MPPALEGGAGYIGGIFLGNGRKPFPSSVVFLMSTDGAIFPERLREMTFLRSKKEGSQEAKGK